MITSRKPGGPRIAVPRPPKGPPMGPVPVPPSSTRRETMWRFYDLFGGLDELRGTVTNVLPPDVEQTKNGYQVCVDMPGIDKDTLKVELATQEWILVKAQRTYSNGYIKMYQRNVLIPRDVDLGKITANYENGVVTVNLPKQTSTSATSIPITVK